MSSLAQGERWQAASGWAARLIPGSATTRNRKGPVGVGADGYARSRPSVRSAEKAGAFEVRPMRELVLPHPIAVAGGWKLGIEVGADMAVTLATWALIALGEFCFSAAETGWTKAQILQVVAKSGGFSLVWGALVTLLGYSEGLYQGGLPRLEGNPQLTLGRSVAWTTLLLGVAGALCGWNLVPLPWFVAGALLDFVALSARRQWRLPLRIRRHESQLRNVLIVGAGPAGRAVANYLERHPEQGRTVRGFLDDQRDFGVLGRFSDMSRVARAEFVDEIIFAVAHPADPGIRATDLSLVGRMVEEARAHRLDVRVVLEFAGLCPEEQWIEKWGELPIMALHSEALPLGGMLLKRGLDLTVATFALLLAAPLMAAIGLLIMIDSGGPVLFKAPRVGRKGMHFRCVKFRTMVQDAEAAKERLRMVNEREGPCFKIARDPRVMRLGRILRRYSLDELPQLWNVLRGEMSLVGPRPHPVDDFARYQVEHLRRLDVTPGITGLWQVTARQDPSFETNLALDLEYIEQWSLGLDLRILWRTMAVVLGGTGA